MGTWKSYINVDHTAKERWGPLTLVDADWHAFCQALYQGIEGEDCGELYDDLSRNELGCGCEEAQEVQKLEPLENEGSQRCRRRILFNADFRTPSSLLMSSRSVRSSPCTSLRKKEETVMDFKSLAWETNGRWAAQRVQRGRVKAILVGGRRCRPLVGSREGNVCNDALHVVGLHGPGDKISLFLQESCRMPLCKEMREAWLLVVAAR